MDEKMIEEKEEEINKTGEGVSNNVSEGVTKFTLNRSKKPKLQFCCPKILVVDDDAINIQALKMML